MKKTIIVITYIFFQLLLSGILMAQEFSNVTEKEYFNLSNNEIDIALGSLLIEKAIFPNIDIQDKLKEIDIMTEELKELLVDNKEPHLLIIIINDYLFNVKNLKSNEDCHFLINALNDNCGNCTSLSCLYLSLADRLNLPFYGVSSPLHMFVRYDDKKVRYSIGTTANGGLISEKKLIINSKISQSSIENGIYLQKLNKKQILASVFNWRGIYYKNKSEYDLAIKDYIKALDLNPKFPEVYSSLATVYKLKDDLHKSLEYSNIALELNPNFTIALSNRGDTKFKLNDFSGALNDFNKAIEIDSNCEPAYSRRGDIHYLLKDYNSALFDYSQAINLNPNDGALYNNRGTIHYLLSNTDKAYQDWKQSSELGFSTGTENIRKFFPNK